MTDLLQFHQWLLTDRNRTCAYRDAINQIVKKGDVVLDIGAGSGILSFFACLAGARKVYAIEQNDSIDLAREICDANRFSDRIEFLKDRSQNIKVPETVDVIVTDTGATFGLQGGTLSALLDARRRFLKPGGRIIPEFIDMFVAPTELNDNRSLDIWNKDRYGLDLSSIRGFAANTNYTNIGIESGSLLAAPELITRVSFQEAETLYVDGNSRSVIRRNGVMHGLAAWMSVNLAPGVSFTNSPLNHTVEWNPSFFPIQTPVALYPGDCVKTKISTHNGQEWRWQVEVTDGETSPSKSATVKARFDHSTLGSFPIQPEQLRKKIPDYTPRLSRKGEAESHVLSAFNGQRTVKDLAAELLVDFGDCFPTDAAAAEFVRKIVDRCT